MFSVAIATANRRDDLKRSIGILRRFADIDDINVVSDSDPEVLTYEFLVSDVNISIEVLPRKEGPGRTKLVGISKCRHESVLVIDDDADLVKLPSKDLVEHWLRSYTVIQGSILANYQRERRSYEQPFIFQKRRKLDGRLPDCELSCFVGAVHFVARDKFIALGCYKSLTGYGYEELEACLRIFHGGGRVYYTEDLEVVHHKTPVGRPDKAKQSAALLTNRLAINAYYPRMIKATANLVWRIRLAITLKNASLLYMGTGKATAPTLRLTTMDLLRNPRLWHRLFI